MYIKAKALCPDARIRTVYYRKPESWFWASAWTQINGRYVTGLITPIDERELPPSMSPDSGLKFEAYRQYGVPNMVGTTKALWRKRQGWAQWTKVRRWIWDF